MKKIGYLAFLALVMAFSTASVYADNVNASMTKDSMITVGYDKSMGEKTIKAAVIDSYFRNVCKNGKLIRWNKSGFPLKVYIDNTSDVPKKSATAVVSASKIVIPLENLIDFNEEIKRQQKKLDKFVSEKNSLSGRMSNEKFVANAPKELIEQTKARIEEIEIQETAINELISSLRS